MLRETVYKLETNLDHLTGEELGMALEALNDMPETLDAMYFPAMGKKNRPAGMLQVICRPGNEEIVCEAIFRHTHTLGVRLEKMERITLPRHESMAETHGERLPAKAYSLESVEYLRPEADAIRESARRHGVGAPAMRIMKN